jgi:hypothetical protein
MSSHLRSAGPISWMARHSVAPNLLMLVLILGGIFMSTKIKQEYLPATDRDTVTVAIALPGATPEEVEQSIILAVEEELRSVQGIEKLVATANEGSASVVAELSTGRDRRIVYNDIQQAVDRVTTFPEDAEEPQVTLDARRREVVELHLYGDVDARSLRMAAEHVRNRGQPRSGDRCRDIPRSLARPWPDALRRRRDHPRSSARPLRRHIGDPGRRCPSAAGRPARRGEGVCPDPADCRPPRHRAAAGRCGRGSSRFRGRQHGLDL